MLKTKSDVAQRAWNVLRLALLWARKGGVFKRMLGMELRLVPKYLKCLGHTTPSSQIHYCERELSFDKTPIFPVKKHRPASMRCHIPCIKPQVDFDYDFEDDYEVEYDNCRKVDGDEELYSHEGSEEEKGIDMRAEEFIAKFYEEMKLQRQISYLQCNETPKRDSISCS